MSRTGLRAWHCDERNALKSCRPTSTGIDLMRAALARNTARLPLAAGDFATQPRNTRTAIASGCLQATVGAVERMYVPLAAEPDALCLLSGGAADSFAALLDIPLRRIDNLVLEGLARIASSTPASQAA